MEKIGWEKKKWAEKEKSWNGLYKSAIYKHVDVNVYDQLKTWRNSKSGEVLLENTFTFNISFAQSISFNFEWKLNVRSTLNIHPL